MNRGPAVHLPAALLTLLYAAAVAVAVAVPGAPTVAGLAVLTGLAARWVLRRHAPAALAAATRSARPVDGAVVPAAVVPAVDPAAARAV